MAGMMGLDDARSARQPQQADPDADTFVTIVAGLREHVFGKGEAGIVRAIQQADDRGRVLGEVVFALMQEAATQAEQAGRELDMNILMGAATELIDDISELMLAYDIDLTDKERESALLYANQLYMDTYQPSPEDQQIAKQQLAQFYQEGAVHQTAAYVQKRGMESGADPFGVSGGGMMGQ